MVQRWLMPEWLYIYFWIGIAAWLTAFTIGLALKDVLGGNMRLGFFNSLLVGAFWPLFMLALAVGMVYEIYLTFREV